jgi:hypothetical protein
MTPDKPLFVYFAPVATHAPDHVPKEYADKYKGKFDAKLAELLPSYVRSIALERGGEWRVEAETDQVVAQFGLANLRMKWDAKRFPWTCATRFPLPSPVCF